jgi:hypothetical protein
MKLLHSFRKTLPHRQHTTTDGVARQTRYVASLAIPALLCATIAGLAACHDDKEVLTQPRSPGVANRSVGAKPSAIRRGEAEFAELSASAPSAAGYYFDSTGALVVQVRDSMDHGAARGVVARLLATRAISTDRHFRGTIVIRPAQYTFYQLASWRDSIFGHILGSVRGVNSLDMNEQQNRVIVGLDPSAENSLRRQLPPLLVGLGVDTNAVRLVTSPAMQLLTAPAQLSGNSLSGTADTIVGGIAFSVDSAQGNHTPQYSGTIGIVLDYGGTRSFLTCSHCSGNTFTYDGRTAYQPSGSRSIGTESADPSTHNCGIWPNTWSCRNSEASVFSLYSSDTTAKGLIARTTSRSHSSAGSTTWDVNGRPYFIVTSTTSNPGYGVELQKIGINSGWTYGTVFATCVDRVAAPSSTATVLCSTVVNMYAGAGDSGAPVFAWDGRDQASFAGILWGHPAGPDSSYFSPLTQITGDLTSTMSMTRGIGGLSTPSLSGSVNGNSNPVISWGSVSGAQRYEMWRAWCIYDDLGCSYGTNGGFEYIGVVTSTSYTDTGLNASAYNGTTPPSSSTYGKIGYFIQAIGNTDISQSSTAVYFTLAP